MFSCNKTYLSYHFHITCIKTCSSTAFNFNSLAPGWCSIKFKKIWFSNSSCRIVDWALSVISGECHRNLLVRSARRHRAIIWANVDSDLFHHIASLDHNELMPWMIMQSVWCDVFFFRFSYDIMQWLVFPPIKGINLPAICFTTWVRKLIIPHPRLSWLKDQSGHQ